MRLLHLLPHTAINTRWPLAREDHGSEQGCAHSMASSFQLAVGHSCNLTAGFTTATTVPPGSSQMPRSISNLTSRPAGRATPSGTLCHCRDATSGHHRNWARCPKFPFPGMLANFISLAFACARAFVSSLGRGTVCS